MPNLDIIYDVTTEVIWEERKTNKQVICQTTSLPSFVTFHAFYFSLWPTTLSFERYLGGKALATDHRGKRRGLGPRNDVLTTCKAVTQRGGQWIITVFFPRQIFLEARSEPQRKSEMLKKIEKNHIMHLCCSCTTYFSFGAEMRGKLKRNRVGS